MNNLEILKKELITQKQTIESLGGTVAVNNTNPSPTEITAGIKTLPIPDFSLANATESDVLQGKTFYAGDKNLKSGNFVDPTDKFIHALCYMEGVKTSERAHTFQIPADFTSVRSYMCYKNSNNTTIQFHSGITEIGDYAFADTPNFTYVDFEKMTNLTSIGQYCFKDTSKFDLGNLPDGMVTLGTRSFYNSVKANTDIKIPISLVNLGSYSFYMSEPTICKNLILDTNTPIVSLTMSCFEYIYFDCDFTTPTSSTTIGSRFNYNGSFNNIILSEKCNQLGANCFNALSTIPLSDIKLKTVTFLKPTPPQTLPSTAFSSQALQNGLKIYVPDESLDAYKAKQAAYANYMYPMSQKE